MLTTLDFRHMEHPKYVSLRVPRGDFSVLVIVNCFNSEKTIGRTLDSIISQDFSGDFKVLVHDDYSSDGSREIIQAHQERYPEIIFPAFRNENSLASGGRSSTWDIVSELDFEFLMMCDGDDFWTPNMLSEQVKRLERDRHNAVAVSLSTYVDESGEVVGGSPSVLKMLSMLFSRLRILKPYYFSTSSMMQRSSSLDYEKLLLANHRLQEDLIRYHTSLQYGRAVYQNRSICFQQIGGFWNTMSNQERSRETLGTLKLLFRSLSIRGKLGLIRPFLAALIVTRREKSPSRLK